MKLLEKFNVPVRVDRPVSATEITGHHLRVGRAVWSWNELGTVPWAMRPHDDQEAAAAALAVGWAHLAGHAIRLRVTTRPIDGSAWAEHLDLSTRNPLPDVPGSGRTWADRVNADRARLETYRRRVVALGVRLGHVGRDGKPGAGLVAADKNVAETLPMLGAGARRMSAPDLGWLMHRSIAPGIDAPTVPSWVTGWDTAEMRAFADPVVWEANPVTGRSVKVTALRDGQLVERHVVVLTLGRMEDQHGWPANGRLPWLAWLETLPFRTEVVVSGRLVDSDEYKSKSEASLLRARNIRKHYRTHGEELPPALERGVNQATDMHDEVTEGPPDVRVRFMGVPRVAVDGATEEEALSLAGDLRRRAGKDLHHWWEIPAGQATLLREFIPGEPWDRSGYVRHIPVRYFAAAIPNTEDTVGTPTGPILGETIGHVPPQVEEVDVTDDGGPKAKRVKRSPHARVVLLDGHFGPVYGDPGDLNKKSGVFVDVRATGFGKSTTLGAMAHERVTRGIPVGLLDFSGPLAALCTLPELAPFSRHFDLSSARAGLLSPYRLVPVPERDGFDSEAEWRDECAAADSVRMELAAGALLSVLPWKTQQRDLVEETIMNAAFRAGPAPTTTLWDVIWQIGQVNPGLAESLTNIGRYTGRLMFPDPSEAFLFAEPPKTSALLTVITTGNRSLPIEGSSPDTWDSAQRMSVTLLNLAAFLTTSLVYTGNSRVPKSVFIDEPRILGYWEAGKQMAQRMGPDSRKYTGEIGFFAQCADHITKLGLQPHLGFAMFGRHTDIEAAKATLDIAGLPHHHVGDLLSLGVGEVLLWDTFKRVQKTRVVVPDARLLEVLDTKGGQRQPRVGSLA